MSSKLCLVTKERKERKDTEHYHHPRQCEVNQPEKERKPTDEKGTHHHTQGDKRLVLLRKNSTRYFHFEIFLPFATTSSSVSSLLSLRAQDGFEDWRHLSPSRMLTPEVTKRELLARILASTMIVPRLIRSRTPRAQLCDSLRLLLPESSSVWVCRSWQEFTSSLLSCIVGSFCCKLEQAWGENMSL